jgi:hypothetical protein
LKREFLHRRILSPAVELLHHPTQTAALRTRDSVRRASGFVQIPTTPVTRRANSAEIRIVGVNAGLRQLSCEEDSESGGSLP